MDQADHFATTPHDVRRSPRFPFFADARITEAETRSNMTARTSELCRHGCYMDMMNPFLLALRSGFASSTTVNLWTPLSVLSTPSPTSAWASASTKWTPRTPEFSRGGSPNSKPPNLFRTAGDVTAYVCAGGRPLTAWHDASAACFTL